MKDSNIVIINLFKQEGKIFANSLADDIEDQKESINEVVVKYLMQKENSTESTEEEREKVKKQKVFWSHSKKIWWINTKRNGVHQFFIIETTDDSTIDGMLEVL